MKMASIAGKISFVFIVLFGLLSLSCSKGCSGCKKNKEESSQISQEIVIAGIVKDDNGSPVENAFVSARIDINQDGIFTPDESFSAMSGRNGEFIITARISNPEGIITSRILTSRIHVSISKDGFIKNSQYINLNGNSFVGDFKLARAYSTKDTNLKDGAQFSLVSSPSGAPRLVSGLSKKERMRIKQEGGDILVDINIPPEALPEASEINASVGWVNPLTDPDLMPGSFLAYSGKPIMLSSAGFISVEMQNEKGEEIKTLSPRIGTRQESAKASLKMKIPDEAIPTLYDYVEETTDKVEVPMWYFDERTGIWFQGEELGILVDENDKVITAKELAKIATGKEQKSLYAKANVMHFSEWNVDFPIDTHSSICGQIVDSDGNGIPGLFIRTEGVTYGGLGDWKGTYTDAQGNFCADVKKSEPSGSLGGGECSNLKSDVIEQCKDLLFLGTNAHEIFISDINSISFAVDNLKSKGLIDETLHNNVKRMLEGAIKDVIGGNFGLANDKVRDALKALSPIGRESSAQIFYERWDNIGEEATKFLISNLIGCALDIANNWVNKFEGITGCEKFGLKFAQDKLKSVIEFGIDLNKGEADIGTFFTDQVFGTIFNTLTSDDFKECIGKVVESTAKSADICFFSFVKEPKGITIKISSGAGSILFALQAFGVLAGEAMQAWGEHGEWKSAKAWEQVQPGFDKFLRHYGEILRKLKESAPDFYERCKDIFERECGYFKPKKEGNQSPRLSIRQEEFQDDVTKILIEAFLSFIDLKNISDKIVLGGDEIINKWSVRCQETAEGFVCENSPKIMNCSERTFSKNITALYCTETEKESKYEFNPRVKSSFAFTDIPVEKRGGETLSKVIVHIGGATIIPTISDIGIDWSKVGSPVLNSTAHKIDSWFYVPENVKRNPSRYIGKIKLPIKSCDVKGRAVDKQNNPIKDLSVWISEYYTKTDENGRFLLKFPVYKEKKEVYIFIGSKKMNLELNDICSVDLGNIVINIPPVITEISIPSEVNKGDNINLSVSANDPDSKNLTYEWYHRGVFDSRGNSIGEGNNIKYSFKKSGYVCISVKDEENTVSDCRYVRTKGLHPKLSIDFPDEIEEKKYYTAKLSASDPDSEQDELMYSSYIRFKDSYFMYRISNAYSSSPIIYFYDIPKDISASISSSVCDESYNCVSVEKPIKVKNTPIYPVVKLLSSRRKFPVSEPIDFRTDSQNAVEFIWDFGDGEKKTTSVPYVQKVFQKKGEYNVSVEAKSIDGITAKDNLIVEIGEAPKIKGFSVSTTSGFKPLSVSLSVQSEDAEYFIWDFGDGSVSVSQSPTTSHTYYISGYKRVKFTAYNDYGNKSSYIALIQVNNRPPQITSFNASITSGSVPLNVSFSVSATDEFGISKYVFTFGDGYQETLITSQNTISTSHTYNTSGNFTASVTVYDDEEDFDARSINIQVSPSAPACDTPSVSLYANPSSGNAPLNVTLTASASSAFTISEYRWDFDNNGIIDATSTSPTTNYTFYSSKTVKVQAVNSCGNYGYAITSINIASQGHSSDFFTPITSCILSPDIINDNSFAIGDFNNDGKMDMVVSIYTGMGYSYFQILTGNGDGTFQNGISYNSGLENAPLVFSVADIDSDGDLDIITALAFTSSYIKVFRNINGTFSQSVSVPIPSTCYSFYLSAVTDFNSDGKIDLFLGCSDRTNTSAYVAYGDGTSFPNFISIPGVPGWTPDATIADFNQDGKPDIAGVEADNGYIYVAINTGAGFNISFTTPITMADRIEAGDFNQDGKPDILVYGGYVTSHNDSLLYLYVNNSSGSTIDFQFSATAWAYVSSAATRREVKVAELNNDGKPDYVYTVYSQFTTYINLSLSILNFPYGASSYFSSIRNSGFIGTNSSPNIEVADFTSDGFDDVVLIHKNGCVVVFKRKTYSPAPSIHKAREPVSKEYGCSAFQIILASAPIIAFASIRRRLKNRKQLFF